jgi:hypothetical protein
MHLSARRLVVAAMTAACLLAASAGAAWASSDSISCTQGGGCVAQGTGQGFVTDTFVGGGVFESALCLGSKADPCSRLHGELIFAPHLISAGGGYGGISGNVTIVPTLVSVSADGATVNLTASNGAVGVATVPNVGTACVNLSGLSITTSPCP